MTYTHHDRLVRAPSTLTLGKETYQLRPLTDKMFTELDRWVRERHVKNAVEACKDLPADARDRMEAHAIKQTLTMTFLSGLGAEIVATPDGVAKLLCVMASEDHPQLKYEEFRALMFEPENVRAVFGKFEELNYDKTPKRSSKKGKKSTTQTKRKRTSTKSKAKRSKRTKH